MYVVNKSIFDLEVSAYVNPVNCIGILGKGLALEFKKRFPEIERPYKQACVLGDINIGRTWSIQLTRLMHSFHIVCFPTKLHWRNPSEYEYIALGLASLNDWCAENSIKSIAVPALGCGLGGLAIENVKQMVERQLVVDNVYFCLG